MPSEYESLVAALKLTYIPFAEYAWRTRPEGTYGIVSLDFESGQLNGSEQKCDRSWAASVDVFFSRIAERDDVTRTIEEILTEICGSGWEMNNPVYENSTGLFHFEWTCCVQDGGGA